VKNVHLEARILLQEERSAIHKSWAWSVDGESLQRLLHGQIDWEVVAVLFQAGVAAALLLAVTGRLRILLRLLRV
jgi:hypothetical protein